MNRLFKGLATFGFLALSALATPTISADFTFDGDAITMTGEIQMTDYAEKFLPLATEHINDVKFIILKDSPGGDLFSSIRIGQYIDTAKINTVASGECDSGCAFIWIAGYHLMVDSTAVTYIGFHMPYSITWAGFVQQSPKPIQDIVINFLKSIDVKKKGIDDISSTPGGPTSVLFLTADRAESWGLRILPYGR